jgi:hypothetical protein
MLTPEESALLTDMRHRLRELYVQKAEAQRHRDQPRVEELEGEIDELTEDCQKVLEETEAL